MIDIEKKLEQSLIDNLTNVINSDILNKIKMMSKEWVRKEKIKKVFNF